MRFAPLLVLAVLLAGCGGKSATTSPPAAVQSAVTSAIKSAWNSSPAFEAVRGEKLHPDVVGIRLAGSDHNFAGAVVKPLAANGSQPVDSAVVLLMQTAGQWTIVLGPGTAFPGECSKPTATAVRQLMCPNPFTVLGKN